MAQGRSSFGPTALVGQLFNLPAAQQVANLLHEAPQHQKIDRPWDGNAAGGVVFVGSAAAGHLHRPGREHGNIRQTVSEIP